MILKTLSVHKIKIFALCIFAVLIFALYQVRAENSSESAKGPSNQPESALSQVDSKYVCMITNRFSAKEQIPVEVGGKTYYGCCEMCKGKLMTDAKSRAATDPVSGKEVDKALSVIGAASDGSVYYFEDGKNLEKFNNNAKWKD